MTHAEDPATGVIEPFPGRGYRPAMRLVRSLLVVALPFAGLMVASLLLASLTLSGCSRSAEAQALNNDFSREGRRAVGNLESARNDIRRFIAKNKVEAQVIPIEVSRFVEWRKREWWVLTDELALTLVDNWRDIERITLECARFYGYEVTNFPHARGDILEFFRRGDLEWRNLVMDAAIFVEWRNREWNKLTKEVDQFYRTAGWELGSLEGELGQFLQWRDREYRKFLKDGREWFAANLQNWDKLGADWKRFRAHAHLESARMIADFAAFYAYESEQVPRFIDEWTDWSRFRERELALFRKDVREAGNRAHWEIESIRDDLRRYKQEQIAQVPKLLLDVERFFEVYEHEVGPLSQEVKRFWRNEIAAGHLAVGDLRRFYRYAGGEADELKLAVLRFAGYGSKEWKDLVVHVKRFTLSGYDPAYADGTMPMPVGEKPVSFETVSSPRTWDAKR